MILKELKICGFRPFYEQQTLKIEPDVTVLTGANDVGKSAILDIIHRFAIGKDGSEDDANIDFLIEHSTPWNQNRGIRAVATCSLLSAGGWFRHSVSRGWEADLELTPTMNELRLVGLRDENGQDLSVSDQTVNSRPMVINLADQQRLGPSISSGSQNAVENRFLALAFGDNYWETLESLNVRNRNLHRNVANERINERLNSVRPSSLCLDFHVDFESHNPLVISVGLKDQHGGRAWPHLRGEGFQKLISLMFILLEIQVIYSHVVLLYDEPENSLHADAQHSFRHVLESVATHPKLQVIYATHSPAMINSSRPRSFRLLTRETTDVGIATTRINNKPYADDNFQLIRSNLGISPADSLLYAPITVIVEGATESLGLNRLFRLLINESEDENYEVLETLVNLIHLLPAGGSSFDRWARMATSQDNRVIVFVDGDQISRAKKLQKDFPDIPLIHFPETNEFEDIVPRETYFAALAEYARSNGMDATKVTEQAYMEWVTSQKLAGRMLFSKRVSKWYKELFDYDMEKAEVMDIAIERVKLENIDMSKIDELIDAIKEEAENLR